VIKGYIVKNISCNKFVESLWR